MLSFSFFTYLGILFVEESESGRRLFLAALGRRIEMASPGPSRRPLSEPARQRVINGTSLLLDAVALLQEASGSSTNSPQRSGPSLVTSPSSASTSHSPQTPRRRVDSELSSLFSWNAACTTGKRKGKGKSGSCKKPKMKTWSHAFICLSSTTQKFIPTTNERISLKVAGLGE